MTTLVILFPMTGSVVLPLKTLPMDVLTLSAAFGPDGVFPLARIKEVGVRTALAAIVDATVVRAVPVPSLMKLLGRRNRWAPRPLAGLHRRIGIAEGPA